MLEVKFQIELLIPANRKQENREIRNVENRHHHWLVVDLSWGCRLYDADHRGGHGRHRRDRRKKEQPDCLDPRRIWRRDSFLRRHLCTKACISQDFHAHRGDVWAFGRVGGNRPWIGFVDQIHTRRRIQSTSLCIYRLYGRPLLDIRSDLRDVFYQSKKSPR